MIMPKISEKELSYTTNSFSSDLRKTADGIAIELLIIPRGIPFNRESLTEKPKNSTKKYVKTAVNVANNMKAEEIDLTISFLFLFSSFRSRLASMIIIIRPSVPITGRRGFILGISSFVAFTINWIHIPKIMRRITPGIFEYLLETSKI
jgi:hypothetical protein